MIKLTLVASLTDRQMQIFVKICVCISSHTQVIFTSYTEFSSLLSCSECNIPRDIRIIMLNFPFVTFALPR